MKINREKTVGMLVAEQPIRAVVFDRLDIDYCCGGKQTLFDACMKQGVNVEKVIAELQKIDHDSMGNVLGSNVLEFSLSQLVDHIEQTHHAFLKSELPRLELLVVKVARIHGVRQPRMKDVESIFLAMKEEIEQHTLKEEKVLFPYIRTLDQANILPTVVFGSVGNPIRCMESEHTDAGDALLKLRELTNHYTVPADACTSWKVMIVGLSNLDKDLRTHIHKENSILFPKAIAKENEVKSLSITT